MNTVAIDLRKAAYYSPRPGENVTNTITEMLNRANLWNIRVACVFNDLQLIVKPGMSPEEAYEAWEHDMTSHHEQWEKSYKGAVAQRERYDREVADYRRGNEVRQMLAEESIQIPWYKWFGWNKAVRNNQDPYGAAAINFAKAWAVSMQRAMREGQNIADVADELGHSVDYEGITGFQFGAAKSLLRHCWKYRHLLPQ